MKFILFALFCICAISAVLAAPVEEEVSNIFQTILNNIQFFPESDRKYLINILS